MKPQPTPVRRSVPLAIADDIRMRIESGELSPGDPVPTIHQLGETWGCTVGAAREAHRLLKEQGLVTGGRGKPLSVRQPVNQTLRSSARHQIEKDLAAQPEEERAKVGTAELETGISFEEIDYSSTYDVIPANVDLAEAFKVDAGTDILMRTYEARISRTGVLNSWSLSYLPVEIIGQNPAYMDAANEPWPGGTQYQLRTLGIEVGEMIDEVTGRMPTTAEREDWHMDAGVPLLVVRRISIDTTGRVVEVSDATFPADRTKLSFPTPLKPWSE
ncbi:GntR family transcriptional regulator [Actinomadura rupiterrae]|uniref:GntR family transcriptional regulator n=1 Tax=Actinomadura rupiterrae TaxID=559627 RepID=UPI0020A51A95|nr:GntR family transcriptional regulator [Actinomadura rupiterrae]MCP2340471.1 GntR family transcriptional regulator [Actinomadura rupiterrae]